MIVIRKLEAFLKAEDPASENWSTYKNSVVLFQSIVCYISLIARARFKNKLKYF